MFLVALKKINFNNNEICFKQKNTKYFVIFYHLYILCKLLKHSIN